MIRDGRGPISSFCRAVCIVLLLVACLPARSLPAPLPPLEEQLRLGERMYRNGLLPSGEPMQAIIKGDLSVQGSSFTCVSCHLRSGMGCFEGGILTPPTSGEKLFKPVETNYKGVVQKFFPFPPKRGAYTDATLAAAISNGTVPGNGELNEVMPRYTLSERDMAILIAYLKQLSAQVSPGVTNDTIHLATVIAEDVPAAEREALLVPLENYIRLKNNLAASYQKKGGAKSRLMAELMLVSKEVALRRLTLSRWVLKGAPTTWRSQLEEYQRREPAFAILSGITNGEWRPVHEFCEVSRVPCLFPVTDYPVISADNWYTLYFSKGYYQEGEGAARYLNAMADTTAVTNIIQVVRDSPQGRALAAGFETTWRDLGHAAPLTVPLTAGEELSPERITALAGNGPAPLLVVWDGAESLKRLKQLALSGRTPAMIFVSGRYLGPAIWELPEQIRERTSITFPYTFTQVQPRPSSMSMGAAVPVADDARSSLSKAQMKLDDKLWRIGNLASSITQMLTAALMDLWGNYYSDNFLDVISMEPDQPSGVFGRLSFGPNQRYAAKGCYIVQLGPGPNPELVKKSGWLTY